MMHCPPCGGESRFQIAAHAGGCGVAGLVQQHTEIHADRVQFFRDHLPAGRYTITHLARVRAQGEATAPGAKVEEMYHPERFT